MVKGSIKLRSYYLTMFPLGSSGEVEEKPSEFHPGPYKCNPETGFRVQGSFHFLVRVMGPGILRLVSEDKKPEPWNPRFMI